MEEDVLVAVLRDGGRQEDQGSLREGAGFEGISQRFSPNAARISAGSDFSIEGLMIEKVFACTDA